MGHGPLLYGPLVLGPRHECYGAGASIWWCHVAGSDHVVPLKNLTWRELDALWDGARFSLAYDAGATAIFVERNTRLIRMGLDPDFRNKEG